MNLDRTTDALLDAPLVELRYLVERILSKAPGIDKLPPLAERIPLDEVISNLDALIEKSARVRGYLDGRYGHGCGDHGHDEAVKISNALASKVRKGLGFLQSRKDLRF